MPRDRHAHNMSTAVDIRERPVRAVDERNRRPGIVGLRATADLLRHATGLRPRTQAGMLDGTGGRTRRATICAGPVSRTVAPGAHGSAPTCTPTRPPGVSMR